MGQKLDKQAEKEEQSQDKSELSSSDQSDDTSEEQGEGIYATSCVTSEISRNASSPATGPAKEEACEEAVAARPIRDQDQQNVILTTRRKWGGACQSVTPTQEVSKSECPAGSRQTLEQLIHKTFFRNKAAVQSGPEAMEEQIAKSGISQNKDPDEEDFVVLEKEDSWNTDSFVTRVDLAQPSRTICSDILNEERSRRKSDRHLVAGTDSEGAHVERDPRLPEVTGSRCRLKEAGQVVAAHSGRGAQGVRESEQEAVPEQNQTMGSVERTKNSENIPEELWILEESGEERESKRRPKEAPVSGSGSFNKSAEADHCAALMQSSSSDVPRNTNSLLLEECDSNPDSIHDKTDFPEMSSKEEGICSSAVVAPRGQSSDEVEACQPEEVPKAKGPPPPVPKKPKNPFIKLKTAQLRSGDGQKRVKDHLRPEVKRRHTFDFSKVVPRNTPATQDMFSLWDERGTYTVPDSSRPLSVDVSQWEHLSPGHMDNQYGDMIDYDYCARIAQMSPDEEQQNLDMLQRLIYFESRSRYKPSPPSPVAKKPQNTFPPKETLQTPEIEEESPRLKRTSSEKIKTQSTVVNDSSDNRDNDLRAKFGCNRDEGDGGETDSYKPVSEMVKERNQLQRSKTWATSDGAKFKAKAKEQNTSVNVSQIKNTFDVPKKSRERPPEPPQPAKKGMSFESLYKTRKDPTVAVEEI